MSMQLDHQWVLSELKKKINLLNWKKTADDVRPFVRASEQPSIDLWSKELFLYQLDKLERYL